MPDSLLLFAVIRFRPLWARPKSSVRDNYTDPRPPNLVVVIPMGEMRTKRQGSS
ncbi:hypothetical protein V8C44DRAFT_321790 [Trichoderma aethiopicum]